MRARRSDARRNHDRIVEAARALFAECGLATTVGQVAERAGVGKATVYRSFPTRAALVSSMVGQRAEWMSERLRLALRAEDAWAEFRAIVHDTMARILEDRIFGQVVAPPPRPDAEVVAGFDATLDILCARAKAQGRMAAAVTPGDVRLLVSGLAMALAAKGDTDERSWRRGADLVIRACRHGEDEKGQGRR